MVKTLFVFLLLVFEASVGAGAEQSQLQDVIAKRYKEEILPIFRRKCFHCHVKKHTGWVENRYFFQDTFKETVELALEGYEMAEDFPVDDLKDELTMIRSQIKNEAMPPSINVAISPFSSLTDSDAELILKWVNGSLDALKAEKEKTQVNE